MGWRGGRAVFWELSHAQHPCSQAPSSEGAVRMHQHQPQGCHHQTRQHNIGRCPAFTPCAASRALVNIGNLPVVAGRACPCSAYPPQDTHCSSPGQFCCPHGEATCLTHPAAGMKAVRQAEMRWEAKGQQHCFPGWPGRWPGPGK